MMRVRKTVLPFGTHHAPNGVLNATREWCEGRVELFNNLRKQGVQFPIPWGHQKQALPLDPEKAKDEDAFHQSKNNAGYFDVFEIDEKAQAVVMEADIPAAKRIEDDGSIVYDAELPDGTKAEGKIKEVSIGIWDWTDGKGVTHKDCPIHVALTTLPVVAGQSGFVPVDDSPKPVICLSTRTLFGPATPIGQTPPRTELATERTMPDEPKDKPEGEPTEKPEGGEKPEGKDSKLKSGKSVSERVTEIATKLQIGVPEMIPDDADEALDMLYIAACAIAGPSPQENQVQPATPPGSGPIMLSTLISAGGPHVAAMRKIDKDEREKLNARIDALQERGLSKEDYADLKGQVPKLELSLTAEGDVVKPELAKTLDILERNLPTKLELATRQANPNVTAVDPPVKPPEPKSDEAILDTVAQNTGLLKPAAK